VSKEQLRAEAWCRLFRDVYVRADVEVTHALRCRAAALILPPTAVFSGRSAAYLHGAHLLVDADAPVEVTVNRKLRKRAGIAVRRSDLSDDDIVPVRGLRGTTPVRTAFDLARQPGLEDGVVAVDALLTIRRVTIEQVAAYAAARGTWPGASRVAVVLALAVPGAESPMETRLRLVLVRAGLPVPALQHRVYDSQGHRVARLDLAYVRERLGIDYDGGCHFNARSARKDLRRQNALRSLGWGIFRFTGEDVLEAPTRTAAEVRAALHDWNVGGRFRANEHR
jgi:hypothetical protein